MKVIYYNDEYEAGKHKIKKVWAEFMGINEPSIPEDCSVLGLDEFYNRNLARLLFRNSDPLVEDLPDKYYVDADEKLRDNGGNLVIIVPNSQKESYKLSQLYGLTHEQLDTYIDKNVTNLAEAKAFLKKLSAVVLWLVKQSKLDE